MKPINLSRGKRGLAVLLAVLLTIPTIPARVTAAETISGGDASGVNEETVSAVSGSDASDTEAGVPQVGGDVVKKVTFSDASAYELSLVDPDTVDVLPGEDGDQYILFARTETNGSKESYVQFNFTDDEKAKIEEKKGFVLDWDLKILDIQGTVNLFESKDKNNKWGPSGTIDANGNITYGGTTFGTITMNEEHRISLVFDTEKGVITCFVDGERLGGEGTVATEFVPSLFRIGAKKGAGVIFEMDNFRIYQGTVLRTAEQDAAEESPAKGGDVVKKVTFSDASAYELSLVDPDTVDVLSDTDGNQYILFARTETNGSKESYVQFNFTDDEKAKIEEKKGFVLDWDLKILDIQGTVNLFESKDKNNKWGPSGTIDANGNITYGGTTFGTITMNEEHRISLVFDTEKGVITCFVDGERLGGEGTVATGFVPGLFRIGAKKGAGVIFEMDNFRIYQGTVLRTAEQDAAEESPAKGGEVVKKVTFSDPSDYWLAAKENPVGVWTDEDGNQYLHFARTENTNDSLVDFDFTEDEILMIKEKNGFVLDCDLTLKEIGGTGIDFFSSKDKNNSWGLSGVIDADGNITYCGTTFGTITMNEEHRISLVFDTEKGVVTCFVDGVRLGEEGTFNPTFVPAMFRIGAKTSSGNVIFDLDDFRIYQGTILRTAEQDGAEEETPAKGGDVIKTVTFSDRSGYWIADKGNPVGVLADTDGNYYLRFCRTENTNDSLVDFDFTEDEISKIKEKSGFVVDCDLTLNEIGGNGIEFFSSKDKNNSWGLSGVIDSTGSITYCGTNFGTITMNEEHRISLVFDTEKGAVTCFVDGVRLGGEGTFDPTFEPAMFRIGAKTGSGNVIFDLDNFRIYQGTVLRTDKQDAQMSGVDLIRKITFSNEKKGGYSIDNKYNTICEIRTDEENDSYFYFNRTGSIATDDSHMDINITAAEMYKMYEKYGFVLSCDITVEKNEGSIDFFSAEDSYDKWKMKGSISSSGNITYCGVSFGKITLQEEHRISLVFDTLTSKVTCYVDGERLGGEASFDSMDFTQMPSMFRIGANKGSGDIIFELDNFRLYQGTLLRTAEQDAAEGNEAVKFAVTPANFVSAMETAENAVKYIGKNDLLVMVNNGAYIWQKEKQISEVLSYLDDGAVMIPKTLAEACFGTLELDGKNVAVAVKDGQTFLSLEDLCKVLNRHFYWDGRGFAVASVNEFTLRDSVEVQYLQEPIDTIYRYLQFERPTGEKLAQIIKENNPNNEHPRLLGTAEDFERLKQNVKNNDTMAAWAQRVIQDADRYIESGVEEYVITPGSPPRLLEVSRRVWARLLSYSEAYVLTGDTKYADAAWRDVEELCENYPDWNDYRHFLDTAEMAYGVAIAYDMFYYNWTEEQKAIVREAMIRNAFEPGLLAYSGKHRNGYWINGDDNWTAVCPGGLLAAAVAMVDDADTAPYCEILLGETVQSFEYICSLFFPDGAWYEGTSYLNYTVQYMWAGIGSLMTATDGNDFGLLDAPGIAGAPSFMLAMHGPAEGAFNFHDCSRGFAIDGSSLWLAKALGVDSFQNDYMKLAQLLNASGGRADILLATYDSSFEDVEEGMPLDQYFKGVDTGTMRSGWLKSSIWAGVHAGQNGIDHSHLDLGEFVFEAGGIRWVRDPGADSYNIPGYFGEAGFDIYRLRAEANNCLVINPREGYQGQNLKCTTEMIRQESGERGAIMAFDLTNAYVADASKVTRGFMLGDDRRSFLIRDEVEGIKQENSEIYWFMNLAQSIPEQNIQINEEDQTVVFKTTSGEELMLSFWTDADVCEFGTMKCVPLETSPTVEGMADDSAWLKFYIKLKASDSMNLSVKLVPQTNYIDDIAPADNTAIADWTIPEGTIQQSLEVSSISLNGEPLQNFTPDNYFYAVSWPNTQELPEVTAVNPDPDVQMTVTQPTWDQPAKITLKSADGSVISEYRIAFANGVQIVNAADYQPLEIVGVDASSEPQPENGKENVFDGNPSTRWSTDGDGEWIEIDLGEEKHFDALQMAFYLGGTRTTNFDLQVSSDRKTYETIYSGDTTGKTDQCEVYKLSGTGRYIRFVGHYNSEGNNWISVNELIPMVKKSDSQTEQKLVEAKENAVASLKGYVSEDDYTAENWKLVLAEINKGITAIEQAADIDAVAEVLANTKNAIDRISKETENDQTGGEEVPPADDPENDQTGGEEVPPADDPENDQTGGEEVPPADDPENDQTGGEEVPPADNSENDQTGGEEVPPADDSENDQTGGVESPATGDTAAPKALAAVVTALASVAAMLVVAWKQRRKKEEDFV